MASYGYQQQKFLWHRTDALTICISPGLDALAMGAVTIIVRLGSRVLVTIMIADEFSVPLCRAIVHPGVFRLMVGWGRSIMGRLRVSTYELTSSLDSA